MKKQYDLLTPSAEIKVALGQLVLQFSLLELKWQSSVSSYLELGALFCDSFNDKSDTFTISEQTLANLHDSCIRFYSDTNELFFLTRSILVEEDPDISNLSDDELAQDPQRLEQLADIAYRLRTTDHHSLITPSIRKKFCDAGYSQTRLSEEAPIRASLQSRVKPPSLDFDPKDLAKHLQDKISCFRIPRGAAEWNANMITNIMISASLLTKAIEKANYLKQLLDYSMQLEQSSFREQTHGIFDSKNPELMNKLQGDAAFFIKLKLDKNDDTVISEYENKSWVAYSFREFQKSPKAGQDIINVIRAIMSYLSMLKPFINELQKKEVQLLASKNQIIQEAEMLDQSGAHKKALVKFREMLPFFKSTPTNDVARQLILGKTLMRMAHCMEMQGDSLRSLESYICAQSVFARLIPIEDSEAHYHECDKKVLYLNEKIECRQNRIDSPC